MATIAQTGSRQETCINRSERSRAVTTVIVDEYGNGKAKTGPGQSGSICDNICVTSAMTAIIPSRDSAISPGNGRHNCQPDWDARYLGLPSRFRDQDGCPVSCQNADVSFGGML